jgi:hypothetical protein
MGNAPRRTALCAVGNRLQSLAIIAVIIARWSCFEFDSQRHFANVLTDDSEAVARNERLTDELSASMLAMDKYDIRPAFDAQN